MTIGLFFILLAALLVVAFPIGGVFGLMSLLPSLMDPSFSFAGADVARAMFAGMYVLRSDLRLLARDSLGSRSHDNSFPRGNGL